MLQYHFGQGDVATGLQKTGITDFMALLKSPDGKKFGEACAYLNASTVDVDRTEEGTTTAVKRFMRFLTTQPEQKEAIFRKMLRFATRLQLFAFEGLEAVTALNNPKVVMAVGVQRVGAEFNLSGPTKAWLKKPDDQEALLYSLAASFHQQKLEGTRKRAASTAFEEDEPVEPHWGKAGLATARKGGASQFGALAESEEEEPTPAVAFAFRGRPSNKRPSGKVLDSDEEKTGAGDLDSSDEEVPKDKALDASGWAADKRSAFRTLLNDLSTQGPKDRPALQQLQEALQAVPDNVLEHFALGDTVAALRAKARYPKTENLKKLIEAFRQMVDGADTACFHEESK